MTRRVSLFEFMPYGAPELLQGSRPHMARALTLGSALWCALFAAMFGVLPLIPKTSPPIVVPNPPDPWEILTIHEVVPPPPPDRMPLVRPKAKDGRFEPVQVDPVEPLRPPIREEGGTGDSGSPPIPGQVVQGTGGTIAPMEDAPPIRIWETDVLPEPVVSPKPDYPSPAKDLGIEGTVVVEVTVGTDGHVRRASVLKSVPWLDEAALEAARRWVFTPAVANGHPVAVLMTIPFRFTLHPR